MSSIETLKRMRDEYLERADALSFAIQIMESNSNSPTKSKPTRKKTGTAPKFEMEVTRRIPAGYGGGGILLQPDNDDDEEVISLADFRAGP